MSHYTFLAKQVLISIKFVSDINITSTVKYLIEYFACVPFSKKCILQINWFPVYLYGNNNCFFVTISQQPDSQTIVRSI